MWKDKVQSVLSSYELQFAQLDKTIHPKRLVAIKTIRAFLDNHSDFQSFCVVLMSYMAKHYNFKTTWWSFFMLRLRSQLYDLILDVTAEINKEYDLKTVQEDLSKTKLLLDEMKSQHLTEIQQMKSDHQNNLVDVTKQLEVTKKSLSHQMRQNEDNIIKMKQQMDILLSDQDQGVIKYIHTLQDELFKHVKC